MRSANPNWDANGDAPSDTALVLADGHETPGTTEVGGDFDEVLRMPEESMWPLVLAASITIVFVGLIASSNGVAIAGAVLTTLALAGWHARTPEGRTA